MMVLSPWELTRRPSAEGAAWGVCRVKGQSCRDGLEQLGRQWGRVKGCTSPRAGWRGCPIPAEQQV